MTVSERETVTEELTEMAVQREKRNDLLLEISDAVVKGFERHYSEESEKFMSFTLEFRDDSVGVIEFHERHFDSGELDSFLEALGTTYTEMDVKYKKIPAMYTKRGWGVIFGDMEWEKPYKSESRFWKLNDSGFVVPDYEEWYKCAFAISIPLLAVWYTGVTGDWPLTIAFTALSYPAMQYYFLPSMGSELYYTTDE